MNIEDCFKKELLIRKKPAREKAKQPLKAAKVYVKKAKDNIALKNYDITIVAVYTSMFHSLRSILFKDGLKERSHICLLAYIKHAYPELSGTANSVDVYRRFRHTALYGLDTTASREEAESSIEVAGETLISVKKLLRL